MPRSLWLLVGLFAALWSGHAWAAPGDNFSDGKIKRGSRQTIAGYYACDGNSSGAGDCVTSIDLDNLVGAPDQLVVLVHKETGCSTVDVGMTTGPTSSGTQHDPDTTAVTLTGSGGTSRVVFNLGEATLDRYLFFDASGSAGCTDLEVVVFWHTNRGR